METNFTENQESPYDSYDTTSGIDLIVENERFRVCRCLLVYASPVFKSMLTLEFKEKQEGEVHLPGKRSKDIKELLDYLNPGLDDTLADGADSAIRLLPLAEEYQINKLRDKCASTILQELQTNDKPQEFVVKCLKMSNQYCLLEVLQYCVEKCAMSKSLWKMVRDSEDVPTELKAKVYEERLYVLEAEREELVTAKHCMMGIKRRLNEIVTPHDQHCRCRTELKVRSPLLRTCNFCARTWCTDNVSTDSYRSSYWFLCNHRIGYNVANDAVLRNFLESKD